MEAADAVRRVTRLQGVSPHAAYVLSEAYEKGPAHPALSLAEVAAVVVLPRTTRVATRRLSGRSAREDHVQSGVSAGLAAKGSVGSCGVPQDGPGNLHIQQDNPPDLLEIAIEQVLEKPPDLPEVVVDRVLRKRPDLPEVVVDKVLRKLPDLPEVVVDKVLPKPKVIDDSAVNQIVHNLLKWMDAIGERSTLPAPAPAEAGSSTATDQGAASLSVPDILQETSLTSEPGTVVESIEPLPRTSDSAAPPRRTRWGSSGAAAPQPPPPEPPTSAATDDPRGQPQDTAAEEAPEQEADRPVAPSAPAAAAAAPRFPLPSRSDAVVVGWCSAPACGAELASWEELVVHHLAAHRGPEDRGRVCRKCLERLPDGSRGHDRHRQAHRVVSFRCVACTAVFLSPEQLNEHMHVFHRMPPKAPAEAAAASGPTPSAARPAAPPGAQRGARIGRCPHRGCDSPFSSWAAHVAHYLEQHVPQSAGLGRTCGRCLVSCHKNIFHMHLANHETRRGFPCNVCSAVFVERNHLAEHKQNTHASKV